MNLKTVDLTISIKRQMIIQNMNLELSQGALLWLQGDSGAGKSMLLKSIVGLVKYHGDIFMNNENISGHSFNKRIQNGVSYFPQERIEYPFAKVLKNISYVEKLLRKKNEIIDENKYARLRGIFNLEPIINKKMRELSIGQYKRVGLYLSLLAKSELFLFDEPLAGQDDDFSKAFCDLMAIYAKEGKSIIIAEHRNLDEYFGYSVNSYRIRNL